MELDLITFETAKLAHEKGLSLPTEHKFFVDTDGDVEEADKNDFVHDHVVACFVRPTQALLQKWLREEHKINLAPHLPWIKNGWELKAFSLIKGKELFWVFKYKKYKTYEEVLEAGLQEALKLI